MQMTQEEKRIKLCELAGWKGIVASHMIGYAPWRPVTYEERIQKTPVMEFYSIPLDPLPDYFSSLNAVHELEQQTWSKEWNLRDDFCDHLALIIDPVHGYKGLKATDALQAIAAQRAEALGRTLSLWTE
jgi:hypothetical protein